MVTFRRWAEPPIRFAPKYAILPGRQPRGALYKWQMKGYSTSVLNINRVRKDLFCKYLSPAVPDWLVGI